jgi:hypothetical protein
MSFLLGSKREPGAVSGCRAPVPTRVNLKHAVIATFRASTRSDGVLGRLTPGGEDGCCRSLESIKVVPGRAVLGTGDARRYDRTS